MLLDGKSLANELTEKIRNKISKHPHLRPPGLAVILVGSDLASQIYVRMKRKKSESLGMLVKDYHFPKEATEIEIKNTITNLNQDPSIDGILVQLPLPKELNTYAILEMIDPSKDADGLHPQNMGKLLLSRDDAIIPCTPKGVHALIKHYRIPTVGANIVIVGRSHIVGMPLSVLLSQNKPHANATVTLAHSKTQNLNEITRHADILIVAIGKPGFITKEMVKKGATVIDVGINRVEASNEKGYILVGDVSKEAELVAENFTPVPGGVGPMTIAMLLENTYERFCIHESQS